MLYKDLKDDKLLNIKNTFKLQNHELLKFDESICNGTGGIDSSNTLISNWCICDLYYKFD